MRAGISRVYISDANQIADGVITPAKLSSVRRFVRVYRSGSQTLSAATWTIVQLNAKSYDPLGLFDVTTNYRLDVPSGLGGKWLVTATIQFGGVASNNQVGLAIQVNGTDRLVRWGHQIGGQGIISLNIADVVNVSGGDNIRVMAYSTLASSISGGETVSAATFSFLPSDTAILPP